MLQYNTANIYMNNIDQESVRSTILAWRTVLLSFVLKSSKGNSSIGSAINVMATVAVNGMRILRELFTL